MTPPETSPTPQSASTPEAAPEPPKAPETARSLLNEDGTSKVEEPKPAQGAPEKYEDFKVEGINLDKAVIDKHVEMFRAQGLTQAQAQAVVEAQARREAEIIQQANMSFTKTNEAWANEVKAKYGSQIGDVRTSIGRLLDSLPEENRAAFRQAMDVTGAGNHPAFVEAFYTLAKNAAEGKYVQPGGPPNQPAAKPRSQAEAIYGNSSSPQSG